MSIADDRLAAAKLSGGISSSAIYDAVLAAGRKAQPQPATILDFGTGMGMFLPLLGHWFPSAELQAIDIMERPEGLAEGVRWHRGDLNLETPIPAASLDLIFAVEVIEHLENPRHLMREFARILAPHGVAVLSTPNTGSLRSLLTFAARGHHAQFDESNYPAHITPLSEVDFTRAAIEAGLCVEGFFYTNSGVIPKLLTRPWQSLPLVGRYLRGRRFSDNFGVVLRKASSI